MVITTYKLVMCDSPAALLRKSPLPVSRAGTGKGKAKRKRKVLVKNDKKGGAKEVQEELNVPSCINCLK